MSTARMRAEKFAERFELPQDALLNTARLTLSGRKGLLIENHSGILCYESDIVVVDCGNMKAILHGDGLELAAMDSSDMLLYGRILSLELE